MDRFNDVYKWFRGFNFIPASVIKKLPDAQEITPFKVGDKAWHNDEEHDDWECEIVEYYGHGEYMVQFYCDDSIEICNYDTLDVRRSGIDPEKAVMFTFEEQEYIDWAEENVDTLAKIGFRMFEQEDFGIVLCAVKDENDLYYKYWLPLYDACKPE